MVQPFTEFSGKMTSRNIPKFFGKFFTENFFSILFPPGIVYSGIFSLMVCLSETVQFRDFLKTFPENFHTICTRFECFLE